MSQYEFEKKKLYSRLGEHTVKSLKECNAIIAGGTVTSLFTNKEINDFDIYFRNKEDCIKFMGLHVDGEWIQAYTEKALMYTTDKGKGSPYQLILYRQFKDAEEIFKSFDFTVCMGALDFKTEEFIFHPDFLKHNSQRLLKFNKGTDFPIISALRVQKYKDRYYKISKLEFSKIMLAIMGLQIDNYTDLKEQLGGMYGYNLDEIIPEDEEYSIDTVIDKLDEIEFDDKYFKLPTTFNYDKHNNVDGDALTGIIHKFYGMENYEYIVDKENNEAWYKDFTGFMCEIEIEDIPENVKKKISYKTWKNKNLKSCGKLYKFVKKEVDEDDNVTYSSFARHDFKYIMGEIIEARSDVKYDGTIYCNCMKNYREMTYFNSTGGVLIELEIQDLDDIIINFNHFSHNKKGIVGIKKGKFIREVPEEEYKK